MCRKLATRITAQNGQRQPNEPARRPLYFPQHMREERTGHARNENACTIYQYITRPTGIAKGTMWRVYLLTIIYIYIDFISLVCYRITRFVSCRPFYTVIVTPLARQRCSRQ